MKKFLIGLFLVALAFSLILGCSAKESSEDATKAPAGTTEAESQDTTSMDSATVTDTAAVEDTTM
jgi:hypothetical protein